MYSLVTIFAIVAMASVVAPVQAAADPADARQGELIYLLRHDCGSCHGMTLKGGLGPALLPGTVGDVAEESLAAIILHGVPGTPMPPWSPELSAAEATWLARQIKEGL
jgi:cytochrome c55X